MNLKFGLVVGTAIACAVMSGCKVTKGRPSKGATMEPTRPAPQTEITTVDVPKVQPTEPQVETKPAVQPPAPIVRTCSCPPGSVHASPCACGLANCKCKVKEPEPEYTLYRVKGGDMLSAICKTYGLKQKNVLAINPGMNPNKLYAGRTIKLPGIVALKEADAKAVAKTTAVKPVASKPVAAPKSAAVQKQSKATSYKGATKEYVVVNGDSLGKIAYGNGITIKCLKEMNGLTSNNLRIGQKLKIPAGKPVVEAKKVAEAKPAASPAAEASAAAPAAAAAPEAPVSGAPAAEPAAPAPEEVPAAAAPAVEQVNDTTAALESSGGANTHTVKEGEDMVSIAIMYNVSPSSILDLNDLKNTDALTPGMVLKLPAGARKQ